MVPRFSALSAAEPVLGVDRHSRLLPSSIETFPQDHPAAGCFFDCSNLSQVEFKTGCQISILPHGLTPSAYLQVARPFNRFGFLRQWK
jgi:hypothetical protein